jgi:hypothetical protein
VKLLHCLKCGDIVALRSKLRRCECGASKGKYVDERNAEYEGPARVLGIDNNDLAGSRGGLPGQLGEQYPWWVISDSCGPVRKLDKFASSPMKPTRRKMKQREHYHVSCDPRILAGLASVVDHPPRGEMAQLRLEEEMNEWEDALDRFEAGEDDGLADGLGPFDPVSPDFPSQPDHWDDWGPDEP